MSLEKSARRLAVEAVVRVTRDGLALSLPEVALGALSVEDRGLAMEIATGSVRHLAWLDAILDGCMVRPLSGGRHFLRAVLRTGLYQALFMRVPLRAAVHEAVELVKHSPDRPRAGFVNAVLRAAGTVSTERVLASLTDPVVRLAVEHSHPEWLVRRWWERLGAERTRQRLEANNRPAPRCLHVNRLLTTRERLLTVLAGRGVAHPALPEAVIVQGGGAVEALPGYREGWFWVQDGAAQWPVRLLDPQPGEVLLDLCAAPGGKTAQMAVLTGNRACIRAVDLSPVRLLRLQGNLQRLAIDGVDVVVGDVTDPGVVAGGPYHRILADLPCSGTGVIRRHPEIKWRRQSGDPQRMAEVQRRMLDNCAAVLLPGGVLVYAVCSLEPEEGEEQIVRFLATHPGWRRMALDDVVGELPIGVVTSAGDLLFEPARDDLDGFFVARLVKPDASFQQSQPS